MELKPAIMRRSVVLPQPEGPRRVKNSPSLNVQRNAVQRGEIAVALDGVLNDDLIAHVVSSRHV